MLNNKLAKAVRLAIAFGGASTAVFAANVNAAEEEAAEAVERIEVTGSRIKRSDLQGVSPVTVLTNEDMKLEGNLTVADALRNSNLNSFGSFSERSGSSAQSQATIDLRGAGSQRTLVLIDGKRFPGSPTLGGASANLNALPMAAVERIEILTDGASSVYGSDAMAGVVNIIMKKDYEGLEFSAGVGKRDRDEGTTSNEFSIVTGFQTDKGGITFAFDHQQRDGIADADREFTAPWMRDLDGDGTIQAYAETDGWSIYGATVAAPDFSEAQAGLGCDALIAEYGDNVFRKVAADADWSPGSTYCMYAYGNVSYNKASTNKNTLYVDADYELTDNVEFFSRVMFSQNESFGRYAPPAAPYRNMPADHPDNPYGEVTTGYYRWVGIGTRDGNVHDYNQDYLMGLRGDLEWNNASWEVYYHYNKADNKSMGEYYLSYAGLAYNNANDIPLTSAEGIANMKATTLTQSKATFNQINAGLNFDLIELPGGEGAHFFGAEYFDTVYSEVYDAQSEANQIGGSAGNSSGGDRQVWAVFYEGAYPVLDNLEINVAARYDDYSDFGGELSPKIGARYQPMDTLVLRASYSESFRAPALNRLYAATTFSADSGTDYAFCAERNISETDCPSKQYDTYIRANKDLGPETSQYINLGLAWDPVDSLGITLDYFDLDIDNVISRRSITNVMEGIYSGTLTPTNTFYVKRAPDNDLGQIGTAIEVGTGYGNGDKMQITGIDLAFNGNFDLGVGELGLNWNNSFIMDYIVEVEGGGAGIDTAGWAGQPDYKSVFTTSYSLDDHSIAWNINYTAGTYENKTEGNLDSWLIHNLNYVYNSEFGKFQVGINNLTDEDPVLTSDGKYTNADLYNNYGREYTLRYTISF
jgi:iron complex outermembrane receptor protein